MNAHALLWSSLTMQADLDRGSQSFLLWFIENLGLSGLFMIFLGLAVFIGACVVVATSRRASAIAAYLVLLPLPMYIGILGILKGVIASLSVIALSEAQLKASEIAAALECSVLSIFVGLLVTLPTYLVLAVGLLLRACNSSPSSAP